MIDISKLKISKYPRYEDYILIENLVNSKVFYKRGYEENLLINNEEFKAWQEYFCYYYKPSLEKKVLFFHKCSWAKPYDFSCTINKIKKIVDKYPFVHSVFVK